MTLASIQQAQGWERKNSTYQNGSVKTRIGHGVQWSVGTEGRVLSFREMTSSEFTVYMEIEQGCWVSLSFLTSNPSHHWWLPGGRRCMLLIQQKKSYVMRNSKGKVWCLWHCYISCYPEVGVCKDNMSRAAVVPGGSLWEPVNEGDLENLLRTEPCVPPCLSVCSSAEGPRSPCSTLDQWT